MKSILRGGRGKKGEEGKDGGEKRREAYISLRSYSPRAPTSRAVRASCEAEGGCVLQGLGLIVLQERGKVGLLKSTTNASFELLLTPEGNPSPHDASRNQRTGAFCPRGHRGPARTGENPEKRYRGGTSGQQDQAGRVPISQKKQKERRDGEAANDPSGGFLRYLLV